MSHIDVDKRGMDREALLKRAGLGAGVLALPALVGAGAAAAGGVPGMGDGHQFWAFVAFSQGDTIGGVSHRIAMNGCGTLKPNGHARGGGGFVHFDNAAPGVPKPIIASGTWEVRRFLDYIDGFGDWGVVRASILEAAIELDPESGVKIPATLRLICNIGAAGISTGEPEGFVLTVPSATPPSPFVPLVPTALGLTVISTPGAA